MIRILSEQVEELKKYRKPLIHPKNVPGINSLSVLFRAY